MDKGQLRGLIRRVLKEADLWSQSAEELLMLTAATESNLGYYIRQVRGPARGIFQMEPTTEQDIGRNYIAYKDHLKKLLASHMTEQNDELEWNLAYQILMARIHYLRVPSPLPASSDVRGLAQYWKDHYNTHLGAGTVDKAVRKYEKYVLG